MENKFCPKCKETKSTTDFNKNSSKKDGLTNYCKPCRRDYMKERGIGVRATKKYMKSAGTVIYKIGSRLTGEFYYGRGYLNERRIDHFTKLKANKHHNKYLQKLYNSNPDVVEFIVIFKVEREDAPQRETNVVIAAYLEDKSKVLNQHITLRWD